jgi:hypothetical protein
MKAQYLFCIADNDDQKEPKAKEDLKKAFDAAKLPAEIEVYTGAQHGWCPPDSRVYNMELARRRGRDSSLCSRKHWCSQASSAARRLRLPVLRDQDQMPSIAGRLRGLSMLRRWRRLDEPGLEVFRLTRSGSEWVAHSHITFAGTPSYAVRYVWTLDDEWRTRTLQLDVMGETVDRSLTIEARRPDGHGVSTANPAPISTAVTKSMYPQRRSVTRWPFTIRR